MTGYSRILWGPNPVEVSVQCEKPNKKKKTNEPREMGKPHRGRVADDNSFYFLSSAYGPDFTDPGSYSGCRN